MPQEIELKLECTTTELDEVAAHPKLANASDRSTAKLSSTYFDTQDRRLQEAGFVLRVRRQGRKHVQTLKAGKLLSRSEWERPVPGPAPDLETLEGTPAAKLLRKAGDLQPLFTVEVERRIRMIEHGASKIEVALDHGRIVSGQDPDVSTRICEVELELKSGEIGDLFSLADELGETAVFSLGVRSKSERGHALGDEAAGRPAHAEPLDLGDELSAAEAFQEIVMSTLRQLRLNEAILLDRRDAEALHQARVAIRRLRSAFSLFGDIVDDERSRVLREDLKRLSGVLGEARNLDVFLAETLPAERLRRPDETGLLNLETALETKRTETYAAVERLLRSAEWRGLVLDVAAWAYAGPWLAPKGKKAAMRLAQPARSFAAGALEKRLKQVRKRGQKLAEIGDDDRHQVRIAAKKLRYGVEFFAALYGGKKRRKAAEAFLKRVKRLQGALGELNDIATARELAEAGGERSGPSATFAAGVVVGDAGADTGELLAKAVAARKSLLRAEPFWR